MIHELMECSGSDKTPNMHAKREILITDGGMKTLTLTEAKLFVTTVEKHATLHVAIRIQHTLHVSTAVNLIMLFNIA